MSNHTRPADDQSHFDAVRLMELAQDTPFRQAGTCRLPGLLASLLVVTCCSCQSMSPSRPVLATKQTPHRQHGPVQVQPENEQSYVRIAPPASLVSSSPSLAASGSLDLRAPNQETRTAQASFAPASFAPANFAPANFAPANFERQVSDSKIESKQVGYDESTVRVASRPVRRRVPPCPSCDPAGRSECLSCGNICTDEFRSEEEYICDGGDEDPRVLVGQDWNVRGLNPEDTVVHFDTVDGRRLVEASNRVCLYAPRFASVRKVTGVGLHEQLDRAVGVDLPTRALNREERLPTNTVVQPLQAGRNLAIKGAGAFRERRNGIAIDQSLAAARVDNEFLPYENFDIIRRGQYNVNDKLRLAAGLQAAITWTHDLGVQVIIDEKSAALVEGHSKPQEFSVYETPPGTGRVRIVKVASRDDAHPGDIVEFTLRFDNVGEHPIGNVTIVDNLTTRLEYVPESEHCDLKAEFFVQDNESESLALRWEIQDPIKVGEGGIIRFKCRVR